MLPMANFLGASSFPFVWVLTPEPVDASLHHMPTLEMYGPMANHGPDRGCIPIFIQTVLLTLRSSQALVVGKLLLQGAITLHLPNCNPGSSIITNVTVQRRPGMVCMAPSKRTSNTKNKT
jgi:hypothetical protein